MYIGKFFIFKFSEFDLIVSEFTQAAMESAMNVVKAVNILLSGAWCYPLVRSITAKYLGLFAPIRCNNCLMLGSDQPSPSQHKFNNIKSIQYRHFCSSPAGVGFGCICTCEYLFASDFCMTFASINIFVCLSISFCLTGVWARSYPLRYSILLCLF